MVKISIGSKEKNCRIFCVFSDKKKINFFNSIDKKLKLEFDKVMKIFSYEGKKDEALFFNIEEKKYLLYGFDKKYELEDLRKGYSNIFNILKAKKEFDILINIPKEDTDEIGAIVDGIELTDYKFDKYLSKSVEEKKKKKEMNVSLNVNAKFSKTVKEKMLVCSHVKFTRNLVNENADIITPAKMESLAKEFAKKNKLKIKVLDEKALVKEKLNLMYAVGKGAANPPRLVIVEYNGNSKSKEKIALVGKGVTFDAGGINLKPTGYIEDMKTDMGGAATVFGAFKAIVELGLKKNIVLVMGLVENAIGSKAYKPGDIFIGYNGTSVEIGNTDAEGRLVLADSLAYVQKNFKPSKIVDMATLTGACLVALGPKLIGMMGNDDKMKKEIFESGEKTYDRVWELPIYEEHREAIKGKMADIKNIGGKFGGTITAGAFLEKFIDNDVKWVHLDIAGAARAYVPEKYMPEFGTGRGVRLLVDWLK